MTGAEGNLRLAHAVRPTRPRQGTWAQQVDARFSVPPPLAAEVRRPELDRLLDEASDHRLALVVAGPGWGKTTAVAGWLQRLRAGGGRPAAWVSLRDADNSLDGFWDAFLRAVAVCAAVPADHPLLSATAAGGVGDEVLLNLYRAASRLPEPLLIVLDDFQVIDNHDVLSTVADLATYDLPLRLMLLSRFNPALPLHRLRPAGHLAEIGVDDLAFDASAVARLAATSESLNLTPAGVQQVLDRTEGWPMGVRLATMHLSRRGAGADLHSFGRAGTSVSDYLEEEVLAPHPAEVRDFLLRTSVAEPISGDLADAIVPGGHGLARLELLERANQFVVAVDTDRGLFRYHPLLRDLLQHSLRRDDPEGYRQAHRATANWLVTHGDAVGAMRHAVAAEDWPLAAEHLVQASPALVGAQRATIRRLLQSIPFSSLPPSALLELCSASLAFVSGHFDAAEEHILATRSLMTSSDPLPPLALALLENLATVCASDRGDIQTSLALAQAAVQHASKAPAGTPTAGQRAIGVGQAGLALMKCGDIAAARPMLAEVVNDGSADMLLASTLAQAALAWCDLADGDLNAAQAAAVRVVQDASRRGWASMRHTQPAHLTLAVCELLRGRPERADRHVTAGLAAVGGGIEPWSAVGLNVTRASVAVLRGQSRTAAAALRAARDICGDSPVPASLADTLTRAETDVELLLGDVALPPRQPGGSLAGTSESATSSSSKARVALARGDLDGAQAAAEAVPRPPASAYLDDVLAGIEAWLVLAEVADRRGHTREASQGIRAALELARPQGLVRPFLATRSQGIAALLRRQFAAQAHGDTFTAGIFVALKQQAAAGLSAREPNPLLEPLSEREHAILAELPTMSSNDEIASTFYLSVNTVKSHLKNLYRKLEVANRREAVRRARDLGLID